MLLLSAIFLVSLTLCHSLNAPIKEASQSELFDNVENYRLPTNILPSKYKIILRPYLMKEDGIKRFTFDGEVTIEIKPSININTIQLHSKNLNYTTREYWALNESNKITLKPPTANNITDISTYTLDTNLEANKTYVLHFVYVGSMDDDMHGFYKSSYAYKNEEKWLASTQFQTNHARRAFPCFDEPKFKATFEVTIRRPQNMKSVSNTRLLSSLALNDFVEDVYYPTPHMSTYLLAFIVSEFNERSDGQFAVLARPELYAQTEYSFDVGQKLLKAMEEYLDNPYYEMGVDKMHMAAIPDFSAGAMENWGLLTYRENNILYEEGATSLSAKQAIAAVITHEQAHMWFGDLVTCDWWSYTWLNEGFARYFQYFGTAMVETTMKLDDQFVVDQVQVVMTMDATNSTNPLSDENTNSPSDLSRMFNSISYNKGGSFIRMVKHAMGESNFQKSLQSYLKKYSHQNTKPQDLFDEWLNNWPLASKSHAQSLFDSFTQEVGYPVVLVNLSENGDKAELSQKRFILKDIEKVNTSILYTIPITYTTDKELDFTSTSPKVYLSRTNEITTINLVNATWLILNIQEVGYYRVTYNEPQWIRIGLALFEKQWGGIHYLNRAQIVDDLLNLARGGVIKYELALKVLEYLETETDYLPWTAAFNGYNYLVIRLGTDTINFGIYIRQLMEKAYKQLGFEEKDSDSTLDIYNRAKILSWSCKFGNNECISNAKNYFKNIQTNSVPVNIRSVVYCSTMRQGNETDFDNLLKKYKTETVATEQVVIRNSLGCVKNPNLVEKYFHIIISDTIRRQDKNSALTSLYSENNENVSPVFNLVTENFQDLADALGGNSAAANVISNIASRFTEEEQKQNLTQFNEQHGEKFGISATLKAAIITVDDNLKWAKSEMDPFKKYLEIRAKSGSMVINSLSILTLILMIIVSKWLH